MLKEDGFLRIDVKPKISVIVPVFNAVDYLESCVESVLSQTMYDVEVILIDDCSDDGSREIAQALATDSPRIRFFGHDQNRGCGGARNTGIEISEGEYIIMIDADDWLRDDAIAVGVTAAERTGAEVVMMSFMYYFEPEGEYKPSQYATAAGLPAVFRVDPESIRSVYGAACGKIYRGDWLRNSGVWFTEGVLFEDEDWTFRLLATNEPRVAAVDEKVYFYRQHGSSIMGEARQHQTRTGYVDRLEDIWSCLLKADIHIKYGPPFCTLVSDALTSMLPTLTVEAQCEAYARIRKLTETTARSYPDILDFPELDLVVENNFVEYLAARNRVLCEVERDPWYRFGEKPFLTQLRIAIREAAF